jgi:trimethylamine--corrinoid protein Co-methyltransferase
MPDAQAGYEKGMNAVMAGLAGLNLVYEAAGMHASLLGFCPESMIIDNDMLGQALRCVRGIEVTEATLSLEAIAETCTGGPGHYLGHPDTLELMQREYVYPALADRSSPKDWIESGKPDLVKRAIAERKRILASHFPDHVSPETDAAIRAAYPIAFPRAAMVP